MSLANDINKVSTGSVRAASKCMNCICVYCPIISAALSVFANLYSFLEHGQGEFVNLSLWFDLKNDSQ